MSNNPESRGYKRVEIEPWCLKVPVAMTRYQMCRESLMKMAMEKDALIKVGREYRIVCAKFEA